MVIGDFNKIVSSLEKRGGRKSLSKTSFGEWISNNMLVDMGFIRQKFTWMTKRGVGEDIWERLDGGLCSMEWRDMFGTFLGSLQITVLLSYVFIVCIFLVVPLNL